MSGLTPPPVDQPACSGEGDVRKMIAGDIWIASPHDWPDGWWSGGRSDCKRCGVHINSVYDDDEGCRGPMWMRAVGERS